jgi:iron complex transport system substrate-binding protein
MWRPAALSAMALFFALAGFSAEARTVTDALGTQVELSDNPQHVVTLAPSLGELAADVMGADLSRLVGVSEYTDYPPTLTKVASVGPYFKLNLERILALKPDLVIATTDGNPKEQIVHLRELKVPVIVVNPENFQGIESSILLVATALGNASDGERMVAQFKQGLERFRARAKDPKRAHTRVLLQLGEDPLIVAGQQTFLNEALQCIGAENVYGDSASHYPRPSMEDVLKRDPDLIMVMTLGKDLKPFREMALHWFEFPKLKAVQSKRVMVFQGDALLRPSLRLLEGLSLLEKAVFGGH